ncbi:phosphopyruvate hydratase [Candidatus Dependentiae bacterium]
MNMKITKVIGREIFDSRGLPTIECELALEAGKNQFASVKASVPSGKSTGTHEALELRDKKSRLGGKGVIKAIRNLEDIIAPAIIGKEPDIVALDIAMLSVDGTDNKSKLGANTILAASLAILKAQAVSNGLEPYELIAMLCNLDTISIPIPMFNFINGGLHAKNNLDIQEFMVVPTGKSSFRSSMESAAELFYNLGAILQEKNIKTCMGDEGGFAPDLSNTKEALDILMQTIEKTPQADGEFALSLDIAASTLYNKKTKIYTLSGKKYSPEKLMTYYEELITNYPIISIEDPFSEDDLESWKAFTSKFGEKIQIVGDDLFVTDPEKILKGAQEKVANCSLIKPNQIGTVTETLQAIITSKENGLDTIVSHRSGETNDTSIVDIAIGTQAGQIKAGGLTRGERLAKYNRLLRIEDKLTMQALNNS